LTLGGPGLESATFAATMILDAGSRPSFTFF
jgi:hypothetical protein